MMSCTPCFLQDSEISGYAAKGILVVYESVWDYEHKSVIVGKGIPSFAKSSCLGLIRHILNKIQLFKYLVEMYGLLDTFAQTSTCFLLVNFGVFECL